MGFNDLTTNFPPKTLWVKIDKVDDNVWSASAGFVPNAYDYYAKFPTIWQAIDGVEGYIKSELKTWIEV